MAELFSITLSNGLPIDGDGEVATINALMADGGQETLGFTTDAASTATDATPASAIAILKQVSKMLQEIETRWPAALSVSGGLKVQGDGTALPVSVASIPSHAVTNSGTFPVQVSSGKTSVATLTPAASAYSANDVLSGVLTFANIATGAQGIIIEGASLRIDRNAVQASEGAYRLYLYNASPGSAFADNAPWDLPSGDRTAFLGYIDFTVPIDLGSTCYVEINNINKRIKTEGTAIYGYLLTVAAYTETAVLHSVTLHARPV